MLFSTPSSTRAFLLVFAVLLCYDQSVAVQAVDVANAKAGRPKKFMVFFMAYVSS